MMLLVSDDDVACLAGSPKGDRKPLRLGMSGKSYTSIRRSGMWQGMVFQTQPGASSVIP